MGLFSSPKKWECRQCGRKYKENPEKCERCENTIFDWLEKNQSRPAKSLETSTSNSSQYMCVKCGHKHSRKPFVCDECGSNAVKGVPKATIESNVVSTTAGNETSTFEAIVGMVLYLLFIAFLFGLLAIVLLAASAGFKALLHTIPLYIVFLYF